MSDEVVKGKLFTARDGEIEIFGTSLRELANGRWLKDNEEEVVPPDPSYYERITRVVANCRHLGLYGILDHFIISPHIFNTLFMQGSITLAHMREALEDIYDPNVVIEIERWLGRDMKVVVIPDDVFIERRGQFGIIACARSGNEIYFQSYP
jgi:hypothetical protein